MKVNKIFISHAVKDKAIIDAFVDLILHGALSVPIDEIFCVSTDGTKIKSGDDWRKSIRENLLNAKINFLIITPHYKQSEVCLNEMGAAWISDAKVLPIIVEPINYQSVGVIQEPTQIEKLLDEKSLDRIKDLIQEELSIANNLIKSDRWTTKKTEFIIKVKKIITNNPFEVAIDRDSYNDLLEKKDTLEKTVENLIEEKSNLENLVESLKAAKDKTEVNSILKSKKINSQFEEFTELVKNAQKLLNENSGIINGVIFKSYSGKDITIKWDSYKEEIDEALANDYIDEDLYIRWASTKEMARIEKSLDSLKNFINSDLDEYFHNSYDEEYDAPFDINNKKFWDEVLDVNIYFS